MPNAFTAFLREQADHRGWSQTDVANAAGVSRALVHKWVTDDRDKLTRLPDRQTVASFAKAFGVSTEFLLGKAVEATGMGYTAGDFVNSISTASDDDLLAELRRRLADRAATTPEPDDDDGIVVQGSFPGPTRPSSDGSTKAARKSARPRRVQKKTESQDAAETGSQEDPRDDS